MPPDATDDAAPRQRRPLKRRRMHEDLVEILAEDIRRGVYPVGAPLPSERQLMDDFGVSRLTVREAIAALEGHALIETRPGTRARVCGPRADVLLNMLSQAASFYLQQPGGLGTFGEVRELVETGVVRMAAARASPAQIALLHDRLAANRQAIGDPARFAQTDIAFHLGIAEIVGNPILSAFFRAVEEWLQDVRDTTLRHAGQMDVAYAAHAEIFEAIAARDPSRAAEAMRSHLHQLAALYPGMSGSAPPARAGQE